MRCVACGYDGPPPARVPERLRAVAAELFRVDAAKRQYGDAQRRAFGWLARIRLLYGLSVVFLVIVPFSTCGACGALMLEMAPEAQWSIGALFFSPGLAALASGVAGYVWLTRRERRAQDLATAVPPIAPGAPAGCRVCGADLPPSGASPFVRCRYCAADSLVDPRALDRARRVHEAHVDDFQRAVGERIHGSTVVGVGGALLVTAATFVAPVLASIAVALVLQHDRAEKRPPDLSVLYPTVDVGGRHCIAMRSPGFAGSPATFDTLRGDGAGALPLSAQTGSVHADWLLGKRVAVVVAGKEKIGTVTHVYATLSGNERDVTFDDGTRDDATPIPNTGGLCVLPHPR